MIAEAVNIRTALTEPETSALRSLAIGLRVLEVGALLGYSTVNLAQVAAHVVSVDPHCGYPEDRPRATLRPFLDNLEEYGVRHKVSVIVERDDVLSWLRPRSFQMAFVDATGKYEDTLRILHAVVPLLTDTAALACHDCGMPEWPGAEAAVQEFATHVPPSVDLSVTDRLAVFEGRWRDR